MMPCIWYMAPWYMTPLYQSESLLELEASAAQKITEKPTPMPWHTDFMLLMSYQFQRNVPEPYGACQS